MNNEEITVNKVELKMNDTKVKYFRKDEMENYLNQLFSFERKNTARIIEALTEVVRRRMYLEFNQTSLFGFLTKHFGYPPSTAQVWIENVRMMMTVPEIKEDLKSGELHATQICLVAKAIREKKKAMPEIRVEARQLLNQIKNQTVAETQVTLSKTLDLEIKQVEKRKLQKDGSVRLEITLSKNQTQELEKVKQLFSHSYPYLTMGELISVMANEIIKRKDPLAQKRPAGQIHYSAPLQDSIRMQDQPAESGSHRPSSISETETEKQTIKPEAFQRASTSETEYAAQNGNLPTKINRILPARTRRLIHQRDQGCQYPGCSSRFQLQVDHKIPVWAGGSNNEENLQLLCAQHNRHKYRKEVNISFSN